MIIDDDYDGQMIFGDLGGLKFPDICLRDEEKPTGDRTRARCVTSSYATAWPTVVELFIEFSTVTRTDFGVHYEMLKNISVPPLVKQQIFLVL